jgi:glycerophosphoryl diester phosphodiesterase
MNQRRLTFATICAVVLGLFAASTASAVNRPATPPPTDFWQDKGFMNMAHQGGETEAPGNTLFAFKTAIKDRGADTLEMDGYVTEDGEFVITHDLDPYKTSNAPGTTDTSVRVANQINNQTLAELKELDFAYKFTPGKGHYSYTGTDEYPYRGIATGDKEPPAGYTANDFKIPTFREVLEAFPDTPINVDMKAPYSNQQMAIDAAETVAEIMKDYPERSEDVIVASFFSPAMTAFHEAYPGHKALTAGEAELSDYAFSGGEDAIEPTPVALQPPDVRNVSGLGLLPVVPLIKAGADHDGFAIHVWPDGGSPDSAETWQKVIDQGADGFFTDKPGALHEYLCENGYARPDGSPRCAEQICPEGQEGIAPNDCKPIPCPPGTTGTSPNCVPDPICPSILKYGKGECEVDKTAAVTKVAFAKKKGKLKAGKKVKLTVRITQSEGMASKATVRLKSSNRQVKLPKAITVPLKLSYGPSTITRTITVKATKKAKGKAKVTATANGKSGNASLTVQKLKKKRR